MHHRSDPPLLFETKRFRFEPDASRRAAEAVTRGTRWRAAPRSVPQLRAALGRNPLDYVRPRTVRVGVTGLARAGKTVLLTAIASALLRPGALDGRIWQARLAPADADDLPRFDHRRHLASLLAEKPVWPSRTDAVSLLALELVVGRPPRTLRLELLDYPGEWLLDLPMLDLSFAEWSARMLDRLRLPSIRSLAGPFLGFVDALPVRAAADDGLAAAGHAIYAELLRRLRDERGLSMLQPGRFLMPSPGPSPPFMAFFPLPNDAGPLAALLGRRFDAYRAAARQALVSPLFGRADRLVVLADLLASLASGPESFRDAADAIAAATGALRRPASWWAQLAALASFGRTPPPIRRVAVVASKADHVGERQRANLAALAGALGGADQASRRGGPVEASFAVAAARCTEDIVWALDGHPVSAVRGRVLGDDRLTRSYPGEVPSRPPDRAFWSHRFLALPPFEPARLDGVTAAVPNIGLDALLDFVIGDLL